MNERWWTLCYVLGFGIVIGGLMSSTLLTLIVIPTLYEWLNEKAISRGHSKPIKATA